MSSIAIRRLRVAIPALNEEIALPGLLGDLRSQAVPGDLDVTITVCDDGSTDATVAIAREAAARDDRFRVRTGSVRSGKTVVQRAFLRDVEPDAAVVFFDADIRLPRTDLLATLVAGLRDGADLVGGNPLPAPERGFWGRGGAFSGNISASLRTAINRGSNLYASHGRVLALGPRMIARLLEVEWPPKPISEDAFLYLTATRSGLRFAFAPGAIVRFYAPSNPRDQVIQSARFQRDLSYLRTRFEGVAAEAAVPRATAARVLVSNGLRDPLGALSWIVQRLIFVVAGRRILGTAWGTAASTKRSAALASSEGQPS